MEDILKVIICDSDNSYQSKIRNRKDANISVIIVVLNTDHGQEIVCKVIGLSLSTSLRISMGLIDIVRFLSVVCLCQIVTQAKNSMGLKILSHPQKSSNLN